MTAKSFGMTDYEILVLFWLTEEGLWEPVAAFRSIEALVEAVNRVEKTTVDWAIADDKATALQTMTGDHDTYLARRLLYYGLVDESSEAVMS